MLMALIAGMRGKAAPIGLRWRGGFDLKSFLLIGLICFLLFWAFWGRDIATSRIAEQNSLSMPFSDSTVGMSSPNSRIVGSGAILRQVTIISILVLTTGFMFTLLYRHTGQRTPIVLCFAGITVLMGTVFGIYGPVDAFFAIKFDTIALLLGMGIISAVLDEAGFFNAVAHKMYRVTGASVTRIFVLFSLFTYSFSLFSNNLSTILMVVPMTLRLAAISGFDPRPVIIGEIIASNIGGASTMIGDVPNMLIASETGIGFSRFILFMTPICLVLLSAMLIYFKVRVVGCTPADGAFPKAREIARPRLTGSQRWTIKRGIFVLCNCIFLLSLSELISVNVAGVALFAGLSVFLFCGVERSRVVKRIGFNDLLFFSGLFVIVGALEASGLLGYISRGVAVLSFDRPWLLCLILMWSAAFMAAFLNAGPTTLLFFPVVMGFTAVPPHHIVWWALSLGVLAGSSATILGATAGPVAATLVEKFSAEHHAGRPGENGLSYEQFLEIGLPMMLIFLSISSIYVVSLCLLL